MPDAQDVYTADVCPVEESAEWSAEDIRDLTVFSLHYAATLHPEEPEGADQPGGWVT
jgi:effector-binding domain-containing protein